MMQELAGSIRSELSMYHGSNHISRRSLLRYLGGNIGLSGVMAMVDAAWAASGETARSMPSIFIGHGSPMNAIQDNAFTRRLRLWGQEIGRPRAILMVSAHWLTPGSTSVAVVRKPETIHDFGGFTRALSEMQYPAPGAPDIAQQTLELLGTMRAAPSLGWGLDHGAWTVLHHMYPKADVPVFQVSIDYAQTGAYHLAVGRALAALRDKGVLIAGSGNVVHNLRATEETELTSIMASKPWAQSFDDAVKQALLSGAWESLVDYKNLGAAVSMAVPTPDHYWPMLYALGAAGTSAKPTFVFEGFQNGTISMRCMQWA